MSYLFKYLIKKESLFVLKSFIGLLIINLYLYSAVIFNSKIVNNSNAYFDYSVFILINFINISIVIRYIIEIIINYTRKQNISKNTDIIKIKNVLIQFELDNKLFLYTLKTLSFLLLFYNNPVFIIGVCFTYILFTGYQFLTIYRVLNEKNHYLHLNNNIVSDLYSFELHPSPSEEPANILRLSNFNGYKSLKTYLIHQAYLSDKSCTHFNMSQFMILNNIIDDYKEMINSDEFKLLTQLYDKPSLIIEQFNIIKSNQLIIENELNSF